MFPYTSPHRPQIFAVKSRKWETAKLLKKFHNFAFSTPLGKQSNFTILDPGKSGLRPCCLLLSTNFTVFIYKQKCFFTSVFPGKIDCCGPRCADDRMKWYKLVPATLLLTIGPETSHLYHSRDQYLTVKYFVEQPAGLKNMREQLCSFNNKSVKIKLRSACAKVVSCTPVKSAGLLVRWISNANLGAF